MEVLSCKTEEDIVVVAERDDGFNIWWTESLITFTF